ncbi:hypothetical protein F3Y22_tig00000003pilonHSYRG00023 [Hibiscus syriacus]|uniref:YTH domain-containing family protein n=1 Tax=Hibiscus syriacus TaxID=106335 RepID=A0A6A3D8K9_HIBSY|nr:hypothetical protein F3Y22_tig00000003pilonHSYRG00023 [Hibiscus syriacus]
MNSYNRGYLQSGLNQGLGFGSASGPSLGAKTRGWPSFDSNRRVGRDSGVSLCGCNGALDIISEQNRGPRALKPMNQITVEQNSLVDENKSNKSSVNIHDDSYNSPDFITDYKDAKFFIVKSYSEDNVHKSIKYGVWASTPNGNKKLDAAYCEAKENKVGCLVNASAQFCRVAEMVGSVDFERSVDYWQQDKWSGQLPVKLEKGLEMLNIFKSYETDMSILDDFDFYKNRQKATQEHKARQQAKLISVGVVRESDHRNTITLSNDFMKHMSKSFEQVVCLDDGNKEGTAIERATSASDGSKGARVKLEDAITSAVSSAQAS